MDLSAIGFLRGDRYRLRVLEATKSKATSRQISGKLRIPSVLVDRALVELEERELITAEEDDFLITDKGLKILAQISRQRV